MTRKLVDDCFRQDERDKNRLSHDEVVARLKERIQPVVGHIELGLGEANGRVAAERVLAGRPVPGHTNSAVDGYAFAHANPSDDTEISLRVVARAAAGGDSVGAVRPGEAVRIFTGAVLPAGCDTVAMQEDCTITSPMPTAGGRGQDCVVIPPGLKPGANVRKAGEDVMSDTVLLDAGAVVRPQEIAALASVGRATLACFDKPRLAIVSTGDEVRRAGSGELKSGQVYDANAPMLLALAAAAGCRAQDLGILPDRRDAVVAALRDAAANHDVVLTTGGASQGEEDHMALAIDTLGTRHFWQIAVKPGRPLMFGQIDNTVVIGLPGNPVAAFVCFLMYVHPLLKRLGGANWPEPRRYRLPATFGFENRKIGRREFWRGTTRAGDGGLVVDKFPRDGSGLISGLRAADGLIDIPEHIPRIEPGDLVDFIPFSEFGIGV